MKEHALIDLVSTNSNAELAAIREKWETKVLYDGRKPLSFSMRFVLFKMLR